MKDEERKGGDGTAPEGDSGARGSLGNAGGGEHAGQIQFEG